MTDNLPGEDKRTGPRSGGTRVFDKDGRLIEEPNKKEEVKKDAPISTPKTTSRRKSRDD